MTLGLAAFSCSPAMPTMLPEDEEIGRSHGDVTEKMSEKPALSLLS